MGPAIAAMMAEHTSASVTIYPYLRDDLPSARLSSANRIVEGYYSNAGPGHVRIHAVVQDLGTVRNVDSMDVSAGVRDGLAAAVEDLARNLDSRTRPFGTKSSKAIQSWGESLTATDPATRAQALERAIHDDPNFGEAYAELATLYTSMHDEARAQDVLRRAADRSPQFTDLERARVDLVAGTIHDNTSERREALTALSRLVSTDAQTLRSLGQLEVESRRFSSAVYVLKNAAAIEPENPALLNDLGYAEAYNGNLDGAVSTLERYQKLEPSQANPLDSLGEVNYFAGNFKEAEKYFLQVHAGNPAFQGGVALVKAASARFLAGDRDGAAKLFAQFETLRRGANDPLIDIRKAQWLWATGDPARAEAAARVATQSGNTEVVAYALCHLSLWALDRGDRTQAAALASQAGTTARSPRIQSLAALCATAAGLPAPAGLGANLRDVGRGYASLYAKQPAEAAPLFKQVYEKSSPASDGEFRTLYAWALEQAGNHDAARPLLERYYFPIGSSDESLLSSQTFPHFVALRRALISK